MNVSRMRAMQEAKQVTLAVAFIRIRTAQALDDVAEMLIRRMQKLHHQGKEALEDYRRQHQEQTDTLISLLGQIMSHWQAGEPPDQRIKAIDTLIGADADTIRTQCEAHLGYAGNNYVPFLPTILVTVSWLFVTFGDSGSQKQNCHERGEGGERENPC